MSSSFPLITLSLHTFYFSPRRTEELRNSVSVRYKRKKRFLGAYDNVSSDISAGITDNIQALSSPVETRRFGNDVEDHEP